MAIYSGLTGASLTGRPLNARSYLSSNMQVADANTYDPEVFAVPDSQTGAPIQLNPFTAFNIYGSLESASVNTPFYSHCFMVFDAVVSTEINAGSISYNDDIRAGIWNGFDRNDTVASIVITQSDSIAVSGISAGSVFGPYEEKEIRLVILSTASLQIDCDITITFDSGESVACNLSGILASVALFVPESKNHDLSRGLCSAGIDLGLCPSNLLAQTVSYERWSLEPPAANCSIAKQRLMSRERLRDTGNFVRILSFTRFTLK